MAWKISMPLLDKNYIIYKKSLSIKIEIMSLVRGILASFHQEQQSIEYLFI